MVIFAESTSFTNDGYGQTWTDVLSDGRGLMILHSFTIRLCGPLQCPQLDLTLCDEYLFTTFDTMRSLTLRELTFTLVQFSNSPSHADTMMRFTYIKVFLRGYGINE